MTSDRHVSLAHAIAIAGAIAGAVVGAHVTPDVSPLLRVLTIMTAAFAGWSTALVTFVVGILALGMGEDA